MGFFALLAAYLVGGLTFFPLLLCAVLVHAHLTYPYRPDLDEDAKKAPIPDSIAGPGDDVEAVRVAQKEHQTAARRDDGETAAGYFSVCREYKPMGLNAKPIERATPVGSTTVAVPSQSVYQTMYRSIFDRKQTASPMDKTRSTSQRSKKAGNVFFVVMRHGHLMLFDDDEQTEVRHVISLASHEVSLYSGEEATPEGELYIKRNAIRLKKKLDKNEAGADQHVTPPFYLFSDNCSSKEDFYFALLRNRAQHLTSVRGPSPVPIDLRDAITLVQKLHASDDNVHTRWLNAMIGRVFLGVHKTKEFEKFVRDKITKKMARVKRPSFLSNMAINKINTGESAPHISNPRLKDLTVEGECQVEADLRYTGNFRLEVAATARIELGTRFKAREVHLVLSVMVRRLEGHVMFKIKGPPSNRVWFAFQHMPKIDMVIEPVVSSRQVTYTVILRQIESRIKEIVAETLVLPFWDDIPFFSTEHKKWRGGIFEDDTVPRVFATRNMERTGNVSEADAAEATQALREELPAVKKSHSMPVMENKLPVGLFGKRLATKGSSSAASVATKCTWASAASTGIEPRDKEGSYSPLFVRAASFASPATPAVATPDVVNADVFKASPSPPNESPAAAAMASISAKSQTLAPPSSASLPVYKPYTTSRSSKLGSSQSSSSGSHEATDTEKEADPDRTPRGDAASSFEALAARSTDASLESLHRQPSLADMGRGLFGRHTSVTSYALSGASGSHLPVDATTNSRDGQKRNNLAAAAGAARRWGLNALQRRIEAAASAKNASLGDGEQLDRNQPMGRGQPLPPPGQPLPMPDWRARPTPVSLAKRKSPPPPGFGFATGTPDPAPSPRAGPSLAPLIDTLITGDRGNGYLSPPAPAALADEPTHRQTDRRPVPPPPLPARQLSHQVLRRRPERPPRPSDHNAGLLVVAAPLADAPAPGTPNTTAARPRSPHELGDDRIPGVQEAGPLHSLHYHCEDHDEADGQPEADDTLGEDSKDTIIQDLYPLSQARPLSTQDAVACEPTKDGSIGPSTAVSGAASALVPASNSPGPDFDIFNGAGGDHAIDGLRGEDNDSEYEAWMDNPGPNDGEEDEEPGLEDIELLATVSSIAAATES